MIVDKIENAKFYYNLSKKIEKGLKYLKNTDFSKFENGKYEIENNKIFAIIQQYQTKSEFDTKYEIHKKYIDIQYIIEGSERLGYANINDFERESEFDFQKDIAFGNLKTAKGDFICVNEGYFLIFTPNDAHKPSISINESQTVKKVVIKIML